MRVVLDEAHSSFLAESYREKMQALVHLREATAPKIFLTATLVPDHERVLADSVGISLTRTLVLRSPTARPNHRLQIALVPSPHTPFAVGLRLASLLTETWDKDRAVRGIVFVRSLKKLDSISSSAPFPVCTFHGGMSDEEKGFQLSSWFSNEHPAKWMISTTALLHGVDYPHVDAVIFLELPFGLYDFVQGAGRAGRSGQESFVAVLYGRVPSAFPNENKYACRAEMERVATSATCRRLSISEVMDGSGLACSQLPDSLLCDVCEGCVNPLITKAIDAPPSTPLPTNTVVRDMGLRSPPKPPPTALFRGFTAQTNAEARKSHGESVREHMERFSGCFVCRITSHDHGPCHDVCSTSGSSGCTVDRHRPYECARLHYSIGWMDWKKNFFTWPKDVSRCHFCGFPNVVVTFAHKTTRGNYPGVCRFSDTAVTAAWHILHTPQLFEKLRKELGFVPGVDVKATFATWLTQYGSDSEEIRLLSVFSWLCRQYYPDRV